MKGLGSKGLIAAAGAVACLAGAPGAGAVTCDGTARAGASGAPELLTGCGRDDPGLGAGSLAATTLERLEPALGVKAATLDPVDASRGPAGRVIRLQQTLGGVPVFGGEVVLAYGRGGAVDWVRTTALRQGPPVEGDRIGRDRAVEIAGDAVPGGAPGWVAHARLVVLPRPGAAARLSWQVVVPTGAPTEWNVFVDAATGDVLDSWDALTDANTASIFDANPVQTAGGYMGLTDSADADSAALTAQRTTAFPLTNLTPVVNTLEGDYADLTATGISQIGTLPYVPGAAHSASRDYDFTRSDDRFEEASVYAAITGIQTKIQALGFSDVNNRSISIDVHYFANDNSFYSPFDGGLHFGDGGVDDAEDADIVAHEYGHAVQDDQVPGFGPDGDTEQGAIGEGFGDLLAAMYYLDHGNSTYQATRRYCVGDWDAVSFNPFTAASDGSGCLRWIDGTNELNGSDIGAYGGSPSEVHDDGRYWSAAMTCVFEGLGSNPAARDTLLRLVLAHHELLVPTNSNDGFEDSVAALKEVDETLFGGIHAQLIDDCALLRGLISPPPADTTPPTVTASVDPPSPDGKHGYYRGDVSVSWSISDPESFATASGCEPATISTDTEGAVLSCTATSAGGVTAKTVTIKRDATAPRTKLLKTPAKRTAKRRARFAFGTGSQERGERFECALDGAPFKACTSPAKVRVKPGRHEFAVRAIDAAGNRDASPARYAWKRKR